MVPLGTIPTATAGPTDADLSVVISHTPEPAPSGSDLTFTMAVTNEGPATATGVELATVLYYANGSSTNHWIAYDAVPDYDPDRTAPNNDKCAAETTPQQVGGEDVPWQTIKTPVLCDLVPMAAGKTVWVRITIRVSEKLQGAIVLGATVTGAESDPAPDDNADSDVAHVYQSGPLVDGLP